MGRIAEDKIEEIKHRADIVEVVSGYLPLKRSGANHLGLCPFHQEKTPSFNVNAARQIFHCFGCGVGGNVFSFLMRMEGLSFPDAVKRLGERLGIEVVEEATTPAEQQRKEERERLFRINDSAAHFYHMVLKERQDGAPGRRYLRGRGYGADIVKGFQLGFAPESWDALALHLKGRGMRDVDVRTTGLIRPGKQGRGDYDLFRNRLLFPIQDLQGRVVAFGGRVLDDSLPKYINSPESPIYHKSQVLYGLYQGRDAMRQTGEALVVEGYFDVLALHRAGFENSIATCGTALTVDHARLLKRFAEKVLLVFDEDSAGRQATFRAMDALLPVGLAVYTVSMPPGADPDSLLQEQGVDGFQGCLDAARPVLEVFIDNQLQQHGESVEGRARAAEEVLIRIRRLPGDLERNLYIKRLAELTRLDEALLLSKVRGKKSTSTPALTNKPRSEYRPVKRTGVVDRSQLFLLRLMAMDNPAIRRRVREEGVDRLFLNELHRSVAEYLLERESDDGQLPDDLLSECLTEAQQALLAGLLLEENQAWADAAEQIFEDCRKAVANALLRARLRELDRLVEDAQQSGDEQVLIACQQERVRINAEIKNKKKL